MHICIHLLTCDIYSISQTQCYSPWCLIILGIVYYLLHPILISFHPEIFFCPTISVLCAFPTDFDDTLCFIILQVITVQCHVLLPCWGLSVKASLRFFFLYLVLKPQQLLICLLESLDSKYALLNEWRMEAVNGIYLFWNCRLCIHEATCVKKGLPWCHVTKNQTN